MQMSSILTNLSEAAGSIVILGHVRPDGDCVGSCLAAYNYLREQYPEKNVQVYLQTPPVKFAYLKGFDKISQDISPDLSYDLCICLDASDKERLGEYACYLEHASRSICLDHHVTNKGFCEVNEIYADASSTSEVLYGYLEDEKISTTVAECLYTGILHDTNVFKNSNTSGKTMTIAGRLMDKGINFGKIIDESFYRKTYLQNQILGRTLLESVLLLDGKCIFSALRLKDMEFYGVTTADLDGIIDQMRITEGVEVAIFLYELEFKVYKVSMRSSNYVDVAKIASYFGGGGHVRAAGCTMSGSPYDVVNNLTQHIEAQIKEHEAGPACEQKEPEN
jgi:phosphoesterase RecJ-like protein